MFRVAACASDVPPRQRPATRRFVAVGGTSARYGIWKYRPVVGSTRILYPSTNSGKTPTVSRKRASPRTSASVRSYSAVILRVSRTPTAIARLRSFAASNPGHRRRSRSSTSSAPCRPSISACVRSSTLVPSRPFMCTRLRFVASPARVRPDHDPPYVTADAGLAASSVVASSEVGVSSVALQGGPPVCESRARSSALGER
mmetsp:Transcript_4606/g.18737  ORF Transcript_4606/g.18737 Transcript_4606/m.18737 type:complete len:201 (+) Transcript_4606:396-998(+)